MDIKLPSLGEGADSGAVVGILVKEGDRVEKGQTIIELENEKAVAPIPASAAGVVSKIYVKEGDKLSVGQRILALGEVAAAAPAPVTQPIVAGPRPAARVTHPTTPEKVEVEIAGEESVAIDSGLPPAASPSVRKIARELGIDLARVRGSEAGGRISMTDLQGYVARLRTLATQPGKAAAAPAHAPAESIDFSQWGAVTKKPLTQLRRVISRRMSESWHAVPRVTQFDEADITGLMELRKKYADAYKAQGANLTLTCFALKALVVALKKHPIFNASLDEAAQEIVFKNYFHIGIAVDTEAGLIVPVIRDVDRKSLLQLAHDLVAVAAKARDRKVTPDDLKGGTFTLTNQGGIGGAHFTPIVNVPEVAILGLGRGALKPAVVNGKIEPRLMLPLAISYDHRVIDGGTAARFTVDLVDALVNFTESELKL